MSTATPTAIELSTCTNINQTAEIKSEVSGTSTPQAETWLERLDAMLARPLW